MPLLARLLRGIFSGAAGGERRALAGALEPTVPADAQAMRLAVGVGDGDDRVVERRLDVGDAARHALANLLLRAPALLRRLLVYLLLRS